MICGVAGHQPQSLGVGEEWQEFLTSFACDWVRRHRPGKVISGMAPGWEIAMARAAVRNGVRLVSALAFPEQGEDWPEQARRELHYLLTAAEHVHVHSNEKCPGCWTMRDRWVLEQSDVVVALWSGIEGGTAQAVRDAVSKGIGVVNLWDEWEELINSAGRTAA